MDDKKNLENHIEIDKWDKPDTNTDENVSGEEKMDEKSLKTQLSRAVLSSEEDGFSNIKQYPESPFTYFEAELKS